jgi:hypothetical protein
MPAVLSHMLKEEYRLHTASSSRRVFFSLPVYVFMIAFFVAATLPLLQQNLQLRELMLFINAGVFVYGMSVGAFGFLGQTYLERRQGRMNFMVAMPFLLPFTFRRAYSAMFLRDLIFYSVLILLPGLAGVTLSTLVIPYHLASIAVAFAAVFLSFLLGLSFSFFVSVLYLRSRSLFVAALLTFIAYVGGYGLLAGPGLEAVLPSQGFQNALPPLGSNPSQALLFLSLSLVLIVGFTALAILSVRPYQESRIKRIREVLPAYLRSFGFARSYQNLLAKEFLDMSRAGALSKMLLAYVAPLVFLSFTTWYVNNGLDIPVDFNTVFYAAMVGFFGIMLYSWLVNVDSVEYLDTLPVSVPQVIRAKLAAFFIVTSIVSTGFVLGIAVVNGETGLLWLALPILFIMSAYMTISTAYLTGLSTNSMLFNPAVMGRFAVISLLPDLGLTILSFSVNTDPVFAAAGIGIVCGVLFAATLLFYRGLERKWGTAGFG